MNDLRRDLLRLKAYCLDKSLAWIYAHPEVEANAQEGERLEKLTSRLRNGEPLAYLTGRIEFHNVQLRLTRKVLTPRPETELLVELAIEKLVEGARVLELGTGSGALALALAKARPDLAITATDVSQQALACATVNARRLGLPVEFVCTDWFCGIAGDFDAILSNPPYVASDDARLSAPPLSYEPRLALDGGKDGLEALALLIEQAPQRLTPGALLAMEHGHDQAGSARELMRQSGFTAIDTLRDLAGHERVSLGQLP